MRDHPKLGRDPAQKAYSQYNTPPADENDAVGGPSNLPASGSGGDDDARANADLVAAWTQQLQVLTAVTAFLASMDGALFSLTTLNTQIGLPVSPASRELIYSCLAGALILHICACILAYIASFALVRYRIVDASEEEEETKVGGFQSSDLDTAQPVQRPARRVILEPLRPLRGVTTFLQRPDGLRFLSASQSPQSSPSPPVSLLTHCYYTNLCLTVVGFILAVTGILSYAWAGLPTIVGITSTICLGVAVSACTWALAM